MDSHKYFITKSKIAKEKQLLRDLKWAEQDFKERETHTTDALIHIHRSRQPLPVTVSP